MKLEEYIRELLLPPLNRVKYQQYQHSLTTQREDMYERLITFSGDSEELSWTAKNDIIIKLMPVFKQFILDIVDQYRFVTGDGFSWDSITPTEERKTNQMTIWQKHLTEAKKQWEQIEKEEVISITSSAIVQCGKDKIGGEVNENLHS